jgi:hypothetical protein
MVVAWTFQSWFWGGGMYLSKTLGTMLKGRIVYAMRSRPGFGLVGVSSDGSAHQPPC